MNGFRKKIYAAAGYSTTFYGPGRPEFNPQKPMPPFEDYLQETAKGTCEQIANPTFDEGVIGSFMSSRFLSQGNLPGFLPFMVESLHYRPCTSVEGACGTGGRAITAGVKSILSDLSDSTFVAGFEVQNTMKAVYGADILAGAAYYSKERKNGHAYFFPNIFAERAGAYYKKYGYETTREAMAIWYKNAIENARKNPKAQEYTNKSENLFELGMTPPNPSKFLPYINYYDCSKVSDGASSIAIYSEEGLKKSGIPKDKAVEIIAIGEAEGNITKTPDSPTALTTTKQAIKRAFDQTHLTLSDIGVLEIHDCFTITAILALEALGYAKEGEGPKFIIDGQTTADGKIPTNLSGGLGGFGHPTGATGVRQLVDLSHQLTGTAENQGKVLSPYGMMISMGGNDITVTCIIVKRVHN
ncbi:MAG: 3-ketoacyl-CoA thiolase [Chlamydiota bacterium]|nr:3-ketoacyl-CoA thiolase [Chlamydiota bacterium]